MILYLVNKDYDSLLIQLFAIVLCWVLVIFSIGIDLYFGIKKSKDDGIFVTHSFGLRKTSEKVVEYLAFMLFMLFIDAINPIFIYFDIQALPILSIFGTIVLVYTEYKSVNEKSNEKFRHAIRNNPKEIAEFIQNNKELLEDALNNPNINRKRDGN